MTCEVLWADGALSVAQSLISVDRAGLLELFDRVDDLARDPRPGDATPWSPNLLRLRTNRYRVLYQVDDERQRVDVIHLGRR